MKRVLITGANSYIGTSFELYAKEHYRNELETVTVDMIDGSWREKDFKPYDIIFHVAGLAHVEVSDMDEVTKKRYYAVNTELAIECCLKAKEAGVGQFVFMSSAIIYGNSAPYGEIKRISMETEPNPAGVYGDSKWRAEKAIRDLGDDRFSVTVLRPPMIYGRGSKGNYPVLANMAKRLPVFPEIRNERSMLYIDNLCEFLCQVMMKCCGGIYWPQNREYSCTSELVRMIGKAAGHKIRISKSWNWLVWLACKIPGRTRNLADKAFGNFSYDQAMSQYDFDYQLVSLKESIERTESR